MKLSDYTNEDALDLLVELIDPSMKILGDPHVRKVFESKNIDTIKAVKVIIKRHKKEVIEIMAAIDGVPVKEYKCNFLTLPIKLLDILNDRELMDFFSSQVNESEPTSSTPAMEIIEGKGH